jgi:CRP/FNR family transcriptional regulator, cyclic AMP receptor protein
VSLYDGQSTTAAAAGNAVTAQTHRQYHRRSDDAGLVATHRIDGADWRSRAEGSRPPVPLAIPAARLSGYRPARPPRPDESTLMLRRIIASEDSGSVLLRVRSRETVYGCYGDKSGDSSIYLVEKGYVKVVTPTREGKECLLGIFTEGDLVGELCFSAVDRCEFLTTMTPAVLWRIPKLRLMALLDNAGVREEFVRYLAQRLLEQQLLITQFVTVDSEHRFAAVLLHLARKIGRPDGSHLVIHARITQEEFAAMVGTTRSRIGVFLNRFIDLGAVRRGSKGTLIVNEVHLEALFGG